MSAATSNVAMNLPHRQTRDGNGEPQDLWDIAQPPCCHQIGCTPSEEGSSGMTEYKWEFLLWQYPYSNKELHKEKTNKQKKTQVCCHLLSNFIWKWWKQTYFTHNCSKAVKSFFGILLLHQFLAFRPLNVSPTYDCYFENNNETRQDRFINMARFAF